MASQKLGEKLEKLGMRKREAGKWKMLMVRNMSTHLLSLVKPEEEKRYGRSNMKQGREVKLGNLKARCVWDWLEETVVPSRSIIIIIGSLCLLPSFTSTIWWYRCACFFSTEQRHVNLTKVIDFLATCYQQNEKVLYIHPIKPTNSVSLICYISIQKDIDSSHICRLSWSHKMWSWLQCRSLQC